MDVRLEKDGPAIGSPTEPLDSFAADIKDRQVDWLQRVSRDPAVLAQVQDEIRQQYQQGADLITAALMAEATCQPQMDTHVRQVRDQAAVP